MGTGISVVLSWVDVGNYRRDIWGRIFPFIFHDTRVVWVGFFVGFRLQIVTSWFFSIIFFHYAHCFLFLVLWTKISQESICKFWTQIYIYRDLDVILSCAYTLHTEVHLSSWWSHAVLVCCPGGHYWNYYPGALSLKSSHCYSIKDKAPVDFIYGCLIFKWVAESGLHDEFDLRGALSSDELQGLNYKTDFIYGCPIFIWIAEAWPHDRVPV